MLCVRVTDGILATSYTSDMFKFLQSFINSFHYFNSCEKTVFMLLLLLLCSGDCDGCNDGAAIVVVVLNKIGING